MTRLRSSRFLFWSAILLSTLRLTVAAEPDPAEVLKRAAAKVLSSSRHIPNYTCVQTVNRNYFRAAQSSNPCAASPLDDSPTLDRLIAADRLRLEVTVAERGEIYSWAGARNFVDATVDRVVSSGPIGSGAFAVFLSSAFAQNGGKLTFLGDLNAGGSHFLEYSFNVHEVDSNYRVKLISGDNSWVKTAYSGMVRIDAETADVVRLTVRTAMLPPAAGTCRTLTSIDYENVKLAGSQFPLPALARQRFLFPSGQETDNAITFAGCREYQAETTLAFEDPGHAASQSPNQKPELPAVPPDLRFTLELTTPIRTATAAAGDPFTARLAEPLLRFPATILAPKGTVVKGRLTRVEFNIPTKDVVLMLKPETLDIPGATVRLRATRYQDRKNHVILLRRPGEEDSGGFILKGRDIVVPKGFRSEWRTLPVP